MTLSRADLRPPYLLRPAPTLHITSTIRGDAVVAEDLEEFSRKRDTACDGNSRNKGPMRVCIPTQLIMKQKYPNATKTKCVTCDVGSLFRRARKSERESNESFPVWVADKIVRERRPQLPTDSRANGSGLQESRPGVKRVWGGCFCYP